MEGRLPPKPLTAISKPRTTRSFGYSTRKSPRLYALFSACFWTGKITTQRNGQTIAAELFFSPTGTEALSDKRLASKYLDILIESINYIIINYALSNMAMLFQSNPLFILFFASELWIMGNYWRKVYDVTKNKILTAVLLIICFVIHISIVYFVGRVVGNVVPFKFDK